MIICIKRPAHNFWIEKNEILLAYCCYFIDYAKWYLCGAEDMNRSSIYTQMRQRLSIIKEKEMNKQNNQNYFHKKREKNQT